MIYDSGIELKMSNRKNINFVELKPLIKTHS